MMYCEWRDTEEARAAADEGPEALAAAAFYFADRQAWKESCISSRKSMTKLLKELSDFGIRIPAYITKTAGLTLPADIQDPAEIAEKKEDR